MFIWKDGLRRTPLPIDEKLPEIVGLMRKHQVVIVEAETGAGKTTRIPQAVLLDDPRVRITMTQPRRNAVRWNGTRIANEMGQRPGKLVGWKLRNEEPVVSSETRCELIIDQTLTNRIRQRSGFLPNELLIIDEAHERSVQGDLLLGLIQEALGNSPNTRVLVTSATIDTKKFSDFFGGAPVVSVAGRCYPVRTEVLRLQKGEPHSSGCARAAETVLHQFLKGELLVPTADNAGTQIVRQGTVLVHLPGKEEIRGTVEHIQWLAGQLKVSDRVEVLSCHAETSPEEQNRVTSPVPQGTIRFVCGTELLRSSVTIPSAIGGIDSLRLRRLVTDAKGVGHLDTVPVSKAEAKQAEGRGGRTQPGFYIACSEGQEYENLQLHPTPAILREPITHVALQVAAVGGTARDFHFIDRPATDKIEVAITRLKRLGALDQSELITEIGELLAQFPLDPERAKTLITAEKLGVLAETVVVTASLEADGFFHRPKERNEKIVADEQLVRLILSHIQKRWGSWEKRSSPIDPATVDLKELPEWITPQGKFYQVDCSKYGFPDREGARWVADVVRKHWAGKSQSDFAAIVRAYRAFKAEERRIRAQKVEKNAKRIGSPLTDDRGTEIEEEYRGRENQLRDWCFRMSLNYKRIRMAEHVMHQIRDELRMSPLYLDNGLADDREFASDALTKALASGLTDNLGSGSGRDYTGPLGSFQLSHSSACSQDSQLVLVGGVRKIPVTGRRGAISHILLADEAAPVKPEWLLEVMPQLCKNERLHDYRYDAAQDTVTETEVTKFIDLEIGRRTVTATDEGAIKKFVQAIVYGSVKCPEAELLKAEADKAKAESESLWARSSGTFPRVTDEQIVTALLTEFGKCVITSVRELTTWSNQEVKE